jgi:hypothetical protein
MEIKKGARTSKLYWLLEICCPPDLFSLNYHITVVIIFINLGLLGAVQNY